VSFDEDDDMDVVAAGICKKALPFEWVEAVNVEEKDV
jgi:hypothetical protein